MFIATSSVFRPAPMWGRVENRRYFAWLKWAVMWGE